MIVNRVAAAIKCVLVVCVTRHIPRLDYSVVNTLGECVVACYSCVP